MLENNKEYLSITELAGLRRTTTETLRHYDRINLFKPDYVNPDTGYRYYSIKQYEKLGTILELRQLGMSLPEISDYLSERNLKKSVTILKDYYNKLGMEIQEKLALETTIRQKIEFIDDAVENSQELMNKVTEKQFPLRYMITYGNMINIRDNRMPLMYEIARLERYLDEVAPIICSNRSGAYSDADISSISDSFACAPMILCDKKPKKFLYTKKIPEGLYLCIDYNGLYGRYTDAFDMIKKYMKENGYQSKGMIYQTYQIDITMTNDNRETIMELQIPVIKKT